jgi:hypothetical protein
MNVKIHDFGVKKMKTKWGTCKVEATHNARFVSLMDQFISKWKYYRDELNRLPVCYEDWR